MAEEYTFRWEAPVDAAFPAVHDAQSAWLSSIESLTSPDRRTQEVGLTLLGHAALANDDEAATWLYGFLANRCLTIAGGTSEIQRNIIAERLLGLPRD